MHHQPKRATPPQAGRTHIAMAALVSIALLIVSYAAGPRNEFGALMPAPRAMPTPSINALDDWLQTSEAAFPDIKPGNAKGIVWASPARQRTPWAVVYIHGFSASRLETAPVADDVARQLGANAFHTRLTGHGLPGDALGQARVQDWMADTVEAVQIGRVLGERVLVISCSTGATLATWFALSPDAEKVAAHVFLSPNFGPKNKLSAIINMPWGKRLTLAFEGPTRSWQPASDQEANAWTSSYPTPALFPMMAMVESVRSRDLSLFQTPVLMLYSEKDQTVDPQETQSAFARIGSPLKTLESVSYSQSSGQHVLAGAIKDPAAVAPTVKSIVSWVQALPNSQVSP